jgi:hypothetical protein
VLRCPAVGKEKVDMVSFSHFLPHQHLLPEKRIEKNVTSVFRRFYPTAAIGGVGARLLLFAGE